MDFQLFTLNALFLRPLKSVTSYPYIHMQISNKNTETNIVTTLANVKIVHVTQIGIQNV